MTAFDRSLPKLAKFPLDVFRRLYDRPLPRKEAQEIDEFEYLYGEPDLDHWEPAETLQREADRESETGDGRLWRK